MDWYQKPLTDVLAELRTDATRGLPEAEATARLSQHGPNALLERGARSPLHLLWEQFTATMVLILISAAVLSALLGEFKDALAISAIVLLFGLLGFFQEYRAEQAMAALKRMAVPLVRVYRGGTLRECSARELVPGDVLALEAGNVTPADCRLLESASLRVQEAALTGESEPVEKAVEDLTGSDLPLGDRRNMLFMGTQVTYGRGRALVVETGMHTQLGHVATLLQSVGHDQTPLQKRLDRLGKQLALVGVAVAALIFVLGLLRNDDPRHLALTAVSIAVAVVPEGLPAVVTITLALGAQRMLRRQALIRKLPAVETLGSVTVICSDKTGTLTENRMTVVALDVAGHTARLGPSMAGEASTTLDLERAPEALGLLLASGALCNDAALEVDGPTITPGHFQVLGDPTEGALLVAAAQAGLRKEDLLSALPRAGEAPFDSDRKRMSTVHALPAGGFAEAHPGLRALAHSAEVLGPQPYLVCTKGAVDGLLDIATTAWVDGKLEALTPDMHARIQAANDQMAGDGMRVLGLAVRTLAALPNPPNADLLERELVFVGLVGMIDPPRDAVRAAVATCQTAGIRPVMITGDHPLTAYAIAQQLGIARAGDRVLTGRELAQMSADDLLALVPTVSVYARVSPENKLQIVRALQQRGEVVAMTGDGVNDAPALKQADIGVAMGITGTDVSKEASDMVLRDDNFATIVAAVEEGRTIYDNLRKFVKFSLAGNIGKVLVMLLAPFLGKPLPLLPLQLLWLNLLTDGLLGLGLGLEPAERTIMRRPPHAPGSGVLSAAMVRHTLWVGGLIGLTALGVGYVYWLEGRANWQTMVFTLLAFAQVAQALAVRSMRESLFTLGVGSNPVLAWLALLVTVLQLTAVYFPPFQVFFETEPLDTFDLSVCVGFAATVFGAIEIEKWWVRRTEPAVE